LNIEKEVLSKIIGEFFVIFSPGFSDQCDTPQSVDLVVAHWVKAEINLLKLFLRQ